MFLTNMAIWRFDIAMENGPFLDGLWWITCLKHGDYSIATLNHQRANSFSRLLSPRPFPTEFAHVLKSSQFFLVLEQNWSLINPVIEFSICCTENGNFRILKWRYLLYLRPKIQAYVSEDPPNIWPYMVQYLHFRILEISHWFSICCTGLVWFKTPRNPQLSCKKWMFSRPSAPGNSWISWLWNTQPVAAKIVRSSNMAGKSTNDAYMYNYTCKHTHTHTYIYNIYIYTYIHTHTHIYIYIYVYIYIYCINKWIK